MTEQKKNTIITSGIVVLAVILAYCFRIVGRGSFYPMLFSYLRSFIYIGLFAAWGRASKEIGNGLPILFVPGYPRRGNI